MADAVERRAYRTSLPMYLIGYDGDELLPVVCAEQRAFRRQSNKTG